MKNIAIIGANGAIGSEFVKQFRQFSEKNIDKIYAFSRNKPDYINENDKIIFAKIDIEDENSIKNAAEIVGEEKLDLIIVATGFLHNENFGPEKSLREISSEKFQKVFAINAIAPALIAKYFLPKLNKENPAIFAAISARVSSISDNFLGGWYAYRASKTALNMVLRNLAIEIKRTNKNAIIVGLHPGTVDSNLSKPFKASVKPEKLFSPNYSAKKLIEVLSLVKSEDSGFLFDYEYKKIEF